jgi:hypothetical protein
MRLLSTIKGTPPGGKVHHYSGLPPELTGDSDKRMLMESPAFLVIEENRNGVFLYRYDSHGKCVGDTWHANIQEAKQQALYEYETALAEWQMVPPSVLDVVAFGIDLYANG